MGVGSIVRDDIGRRVVNKSRIRQYKLTGRMMHLNRSKAA